MAKVQGSRIKVERTTHPSVKKITAENAEKTRRELKEILRPLGKYLETESHYLAKKQ